MYIKKTIISRTDKLIIFIDADNETTEKESRSNKSKVHHAGGNSLAASISYAAMASRKAVSCGRQYWAIIR